LGNVEGGQTQLQTGLIPAGNVTSWPGDTEFSV
jgi:hypothetical protein